jgi:hypothetical protein
VLMAYDSDDDWVGYMARRHRDTPQSEACKNITKASVGRNEITFAIHNPEVSLQPE